MSVRVINFEEGFPTRDQAYQKLEAALARARKDGVAVLKVIHGYGSTGTGGCCASPFEDSCVNAKRKATSQPS